jgi:hypothetical protein
MYTIEISLRDALVAQDLLTDRNDLRNFFWTSTNSIDIEDVEDYIEIKTLLTENAIEFQAFEFYYS